MTRHRTTAAVCVLLVLLNGLMPSLVGCDLLGGVGPDSSAKVRLQINTDPDDPMVAKLTGIETGDVIIFFGQKDATGLVTKIELMQWFAPGSDQPMNIQYDDQTRPVVMTGPGGEVATLTYEGDNVSVTFKDANGNVSVESFPLDQAVLADARRVQADADAGLREVSKIISRAQTKTTVQRIGGAVRINLVSGGQPAGVLKDAKLDVTATAAEGIIPYAFNPATGNYEFTVAHRVMDLQVLIDECERVTGYTAASFTGAGVVLAVLAFACVGLTTGLCTFLVGPYGALLGFGVAFGSGAATVENYRCADLLIKQAVQAGNGRQTVNVSISSPTVSGANASRTVTYDLHNPADPITAAKGWLLTFTVQMPASILNVRTNPSAPSASQSYRVVFDFAPPTASIQYTITGTDGFSRTETLTGNGTDGTVTGGSIPGGAKDVTDTIVADILVGGSKVGASTPISITFR